MWTQSLIGRHKNELPTPCLLLDVLKAKRNIRKMADFFADLPCALRPHAKTHKSPLIAHEQIRCGAIGITCAKLEDATAFVHAGVENILIANEIVDPDKIRMLIGLSRIANMMVCVDHLENAQQLSQAALNAGARLDVLVEVEVGINRCGVAPRQPCLDLVRRIVPLQGVRFRGIMGYEGGLFGMTEDERATECAKRNQLLVATRELIEKNGFPVEICSAGGSTTYATAGRCPGITELQPGSYVTMDSWNREHGVDFEQALTVLSTVISLPRKNRVITDTGHKAISSDHGPVTCVGHPNLRPDVFSEEHGKLDIVGPGEQLSVGDRLELVPSHGCTTIPLYRAYTLIENDVVIGQSLIISPSAAY